MLLCEMRVRAAARKGWMGRGDAFDRMIAWLRSVAVDRALFRILSTPTCLQRAAFAVHAGCAVPFRPPFRRIRKISDHPDTSCLDPPVPAVIERKSEREAFRLNNPNLSHIR